MAIRTDFTAGEVLAAADLNDTFAAKANLASPTFTGTPAGPTAAAGTNTTQLATTAFVQGAGGLVLVASESFSAVSSVSVNGCFTSTYENYRIMISMRAPSQIGCKFRLRAAGSDNTGATAYRTQGLVANGTGITAARDEISSAVIGNTSATEGSFSMDLFNPFLAKNTTFNAITAFINNTPHIIGFYHVGTHNVSSSFDGFTIFPDSSTITGTLRVYGYKNS